MRRLGSLLVSLLAVALATGLLGAAPATAAPPGLTASAPPAYAGDTVTVVLTVADGAGAPQQGQEVVVTRGGVEIGRGPTDADGTFAVAGVPLAKDPAQNVVRATSGAHEILYQLPLAQRAARLAVAGPGVVVDEQSTPVTVTWHADNGEPVSGPVTLLTSSRGGPWQPAATLTTNGNGTAVFAATPRHDSRWLVRAVGLPWVAGGSSGAYSVDNRPPGRPVRLARKAPRPKRLIRAEQPRAVGAGPNPVVTAIPDHVWRSMVGRSWHRGCPVGRSGLRLLQINYWDFSGYRRRGELVVADEVAGQIAGALSELHQLRIPIRVMVRVDRFGWSKRLRGGDDYASMAAGNTSAFNCRDVVGRPGVRSPHSWGRSLDINPWENPFRSSHGLVPNSWWHSHPHPRVSWRSRGHVVVRVMARHGLRWTYGARDSHHFDAVPRGASRVLLPRECLVDVCH